MALKPHKQEELRQFAKWAEPHLNNIKFGNTGNCKDYWRRFEAETNTIISYNLFYSRVKKLLDKDKHINLGDDTVTRICSKCHKKYKTKLGRDGLPLHNRCPKCKQNERGYNDNFYKTI